MPEQVQTRTQKRVSDLASDHAKLDINTALQRLNLQIKSLNVKSITIRLSMVMKSDSLNETTNILNGH
ncbi:hypothetical protein JCM15908A_06240 [Prevotella dentasini JCM 15908]